MRLEELIDYGLFINTQMMNQFDHDGTPASWQGQVSLSDHSPWLYDLKYAAFMRRYVVKNRIEHEAARRQALLVGFKLKFENNLVDKRKPWRQHARPHPYVFKILKDCGKIFTQEFSKGDVSTNDLVLHLNQLKSIFPHSALTVYEKLDDSNIDQCVDCDSYMDSCDTRFSIDSATLCEDCCESDYRWSEEQEGYIAVSAAMPVYYSAHDFRNSSPNDFVTRSYGSTSDHLFRYGDGYCDEDTYYVVRGEDECEEEEEEEEEDKSNLANYHQTYRHFVEVNDTPHIPALGVELEVYSNERFDTVETLKGSFGSKLILERDGSLNDDCGFEIVTQPYGVTEWKVFAPDLLSILRDNDCVAYNAPAGHGYGIHVNVHRRHLSPLAEARIMMLLCDAKNEAFVHAIAQRTQVYSAYVEMCSLNDPKIRQINGGNSLYCTGYRTARSRFTGRSIDAPSQKIRGVGKYAPVNWKDSVAEFRLFQSTLHTQSFMKNLEFVWALIAWTKPETASGSSTDHRDFIRWLDTPQQRADYPNLVAHLSHRTFWAIGRDGTHRFSNPWLDLMTHPNTFAETEERLAA